MAAPPLVSWLTGTDRGRRPQSSPRGEQKLRNPEVVRRRHLEVGRRGGHDADLAAQALDEPGVVRGRRQQGGVDVERALERLPAERLWRLHGPQLRAVKG